MKVGSLVVCIDVSGLNLAKRLSKGKIYTVRNIYNNIYSNGTGVLLEEVFNTVVIETGRELGYKIERFKELDTPTSVNIEELLKEKV